MSGARSFTPREIVGELDRYVVGQRKAKRAVAIALRNRWRRQNVTSELREEISPKNILMVGPTGVGKTEIARRLAKLAHAPFVKVEASKFTEVGYVGRDVESIVRDLVENAIQLVRAEAVAHVGVRAREHAEERLVELLARRGMPEPLPPAPPTGFPSGAFPGGMFAPFMTQRPAPPEIPASRLDETRARYRAGHFDDDVIELDVEGGGGMPPAMGFGAGMEDVQQSIKDVFSKLGASGRAKRRKVKVREALKLLEADEAQKLVDEEAITKDAVERTEQAGIVFLDEIDKIAGSRGRGGGPDVSREGVQRDLLPIVEGSTVHTKYGPVRTDHVLFIGAGAFHVAKVTDLIPELQGRFPIRVELDALGKEDFARILREPKNALLRQYEALLATEEVELFFEDSAIDALAEAATDANARAENIGARRLHTILEALLEEVSFAAAEMGGQRVVFDRERVLAILSPLRKEQDLARHIL